MKRAVIFAALAALVGSACAPFGTPPTPLARPNIIFLLVDDLALADMDQLPDLRAMLNAEGTTFTNAFVSLSLCCPSRSTILRGQYAHDHDVWSNAPPEGGFQRFKALGNERSTVATWLHDAGYHTALVGKYLNGYSGPDETYIPPGWDEWISPTAETANAEYGYTLNENGTLVRHERAPDDYLPDVESARADEIVRRAAADPARAPFFLYLAPYPPHLPSTPAPRYEHAFADAKVPRTPSFDEEDVSTKPAWVRDLPRLTAKQIEENDATYRKRLASMLAVQDMVRSLLDTLRQTGELDRTYLFFFSDNGFHLGQHRLILGKQTPYEEDIHMPLVVRGPGVPAGSVRKELIVNTDLAPTFADLAGAATPDFVDGRSFASLLRGGPAPAWRSGILLEHRSGAGGIEVPPSFEGIRTERYTYVEYATGEHEMYDLERDPLELHNIVTTADPALVRSLATQVAAMRTCSGVYCRTAEDGTGH